MSTQMISAELMLKLQVEREVRLNIIEQERKRIDEITALLSAPPPRPPQPTTSGLQHIAESQMWKTSSYGEWCFVTEKNGKPVEALRPVVEAIKRSTAEKLVLGSFEYSLSGAKFMSRRRIAG